MFVAMKRFRVKRGSEAEFEAGWKKREPYIAREPGFVGLHLLKGPQTPEHSVYLSYIMWASEGDFTGWTRSESFSYTHRTAGRNRALYTRAPEFEGFEAIQEVKPAARERARQKAETA